MTDRSEHPDFTPYAGPAGGWGSLRSVAEIVPREGNAIVLAMKQVTIPSPGELARRAENIETRWKLPAKKWLRMMRAGPVNTPS